MKKKRKKTVRRRTPGLIDLERRDMAARNILKIKAFLGIELKNGELFILRRLPYEELEEIAIMFLDKIKDAPD